MKRFRRKRSRPCLHCNRLTRTVLCRDCKNFDTYVKMFEKAQKARATGGFL